MKDLFNYYNPVKKGTSPDIATTSSERLRTTGNAFTSKIKEIIEDIKEDAIEAVEAVIETLEDVIDDGEIGVDDFLDIEDLKVAELKEILDARDIEYTSTKKADLIQLVKGL